MKWNGLLTVLHTVYLSEPHDDDDDDGYDSHSDSGSDSDSDSDDEDDNDYNKPTRLPTIKKTKSHDVSKPTKAPKIKKSKKPSHAPTTDDDGNYDRRRSTRNCITLQYSAVQCIALHHSALQCIALKCIASQCIAALVACRIVSSSSLFLFSFNATDCTALNRMKLYRL